MATQLYSLNGKRIWVAGHRGMVGSALCRRLASEDCEVLTVEHARLDLRCQSAVEDWLARMRADAVFIPAARVGGILENSSRPADFLYDNLMIAANIIHAAWLAGVEKLLFLGSTCVYPKFAAQPIVEEALLSGSLEPTNEWYAVAKIAGLKLVQAYRRQHGCDFVAAMPTNLYGPGDNFDLASSHVIPALIRKAHEAKMAGKSSMEIWGTGTPRREFLHVDDCADALVHLMKCYSGDMPINVGSGEDLTIEQVARAVMRVVGFDGDLTHDLSKPDGTPRKLASGARLAALGWSPSIRLEEGLASAYAAFLAGEGRGLVA